MVKRGVVSIALWALTASACSSGGGERPCGPDDSEPNDTPQTAKDLGALSDDPNSDRRLSVSVHSGSDEDFFVAKIRDTGMGGNPEITANVPSGYEVTTWFTCLAGDSSLSCRDKVSETNVAAVQGCRGASDSRGNTAQSSTECTNTSDDDGALLVRVRRIDRSNACTQYDLDLRIH